MVTADKRKTYPKRSKKVSGSKVGEPAAVYSAEPLSFESVWKMFQETDKKFQEVAQQSKETDRQFKEHDKKMSKLESLFVTQWGKLVESLVEGDLVPLLRSRGIDVQQTNRRHEGCHNGRNYEFDIIALNGETIVIVEVKTTLTPHDVKEFIDELSHVREWIPLYADKRICGAVAYLQQSGEAAAMAAKRGLFTIRATGSSASITNSPSFQPKTF
ncbi:MAG: hypothetical protein WCK89_18305 [bacterium]